MKVLSLLMMTTLVLAVRGEYRYKIRGPPPPPSKPLPPRPPVPSHFLSSKPSHGHVFFSKGKLPSHRVVTRPHLHAVPHFHTLVPRPLHTVPVGPPTHHFKSPNNLLLGSTAWKSDAFSLGHSFRAPTVKESFLPSPPADFDFQPPKPQPAPPPPLTTHITNSLDDDDDKGPIHTIPAPNLGPTGNHHHHHFHQQRHQNHQKPQTSFLEIEKVPIAHVGTNTLALHQPHTHTYEVYEPSNDQAVRTPDGHTTYYAPDPDPSLPAPKVPATMDPHSLPSNGRIPPPELLPQTPFGLQVLDNNAGLGVTGNSLTSQELVELLNHQPNQSPQVDTFNIGVPQLQQHFLQTSSVYSPSSSHFLTPEFQTFNYEEQHQPLQQSEGSENIPSIIKNVPVHFHSYEAKANSVTADDDAFYDVVPAETSVQNQVDYEENQSVEKEESGLPVTPSFYTTLPNRQVAETLASLAAAGNINNKLVNSLQQQQDKVQEETGEEYSEEENNSQIGRPEEEEYEDYSVETQENDQQQHQQRPYEQQYQQQQQQVHQQQQQQQLHQQQKQLHQQQQQQHLQQQQQQQQLHQQKQQQRYQHYEQSQNTQHKQYETQENHDYEEEEDNREQQEVEEDVKLQQSKSTLQFGERIRPKRT